MLTLVPMHLDAANAFVDAHHRHSDPVLQARYAAGAAVDGEVLAAVIAGRPGARALQDGWTQEVLRVCTPGADVDSRVFNACSMLYGAAWRAIRAMGYLRAVTYTVSYESGASARAAGFVPVAVKKGGRSWDTPSRRREDRQQVDGVRWEIRAAAWAPGPRRTADVQRAEARPPDALGGRMMKRKPCPNEAAHNDDGPRDYMSRAEWAQNRLKTHVQKQCPECGLWAIWEPLKDDAHPEHVGATSAALTERSERSSDG